MDNPLFLVTKGLKAKKKRLGGGGGGGGGSGIANQIKTAVSSSLFNQNANLASCDITVIDHTNGQFYNDGVTLWNNVPVDDYIATDSQYAGLPNLVGAIDGVVIIPASGDFEIVFDCALAQAGSLSGIQTLNIHAIIDPNNLVNGNDVRIFMNSQPSKGGSNYRIQLPIVSNGTGTVGQFIMALSWTGSDFGNLSPSNISNGSAQPSDVCCILVRRT